MGEGAYVVVIGVLISALQACILVILNQINTKVKSLCTSNSEDHRDIWKRLNGHKHDECGDVVIPHSAA